MRTRWFTENAQILWSVSLLFLLVRSWLDLRGPFWIGISLAVALVLTATTVWLTIEYVRDRRRRAS
jgi:hypothetical protein